MTLRTTPAEAAAGSPATPGSAGAFTPTGGTSAAPGPANPTFAVFPRCTTTGNAVVAPGNSPMRRR